MVVFCKYAWSLHRTSSPQPDAQTAGESSAKAAKAGKEEASTAPQSPRPAQGSRT